MITLRSMEAKAAIGEDQPNNKKNRNKENMKNANGMNNNDGTLASFPAPHTRSVIPFHDTGTSHSTSTQQRKLPLLNTPAPQTVDDKKDVSTQTIQQPEQQQNTPEKRICKSGDNKERSLVVEFDEYKETMQKHVEYLRHKIEHIYSATGLAACACAACQMAQTRVASAPLLMHPYPQFSFRAASGAGQITNDPKSTPSFGSAAKPIKPLLKPFAKSDGRDGASEFLQEVKLPIIVDERAVNFYRRRKPKDVALAATQLHTSFTPNLKEDLSMSDGSEDLEKPISSMVATAKQMCREQKQVISEESQRTGAQTQELNVLVTKEPKQQKESILKKHRVASAILDRDQSYKESEKKVEEEEESSILHSLRKDVPKKIPVDWSPKRGPTLHGATPDPFEMATDALEMHRNMKALDEKKAVATLMKTPIRHRSRSVAVPISGSSIVRRGRKPAIGWELHEQLQAHVIQLRKTNPQLCHSTKELIAVATDFVKSKRSGVMVGDGGNVAFKQGWAASFVARIREMEVPSDRAEQTQKAVDTINDDQDIFDEFIRLMPREGDSTDGLGPDATEEEKQELHESKVRAAVQAITDPEVVALFKKHPNLVKMPRNPDNWKKFVTENLKNVKPLLCARVWTAIKEKVEELKALHEQDESTMKVGFDKYLAPGDDEDKRGIIVTAQSHVEADGDEDEEAAFSVTMVEQRRLTETRTLAGSDDDLKMCLAQQAMAAASARSWKATNTKMEKFKWKATIKRKIRVEGGEIALKKLKKEVVTEYVEKCGGLYDEPDLEEIFNAKLEKAGVVIEDKIVKLPTATVVSS